MLGEKVPNVLKYISDLPLVKLNMEKCLCTMTQTSGKLLGFFFN